MAVAEARKMEKGEIERSGSRSPEWLSGTLGWAPRKLSELKTFLIEVRSELKKVTWPSRNEVQATTVIVILTTFGRPGFLRRAMESGVSAFLVKDSPADKLTQTIRRVLAGERVIDPDLAAAALADGVNPLTPRERDVLEASADGRTIAEIAAQLYLSEGTVRNYLSACIQKTGARNRAEALRIASERGWL